MPSRPITAIINNDAYQRFLFSKHHVAPGSQVSSFDEVINSVVGVHSARLPTPYVAFHSRMINIRPEDYRNATYKNNHLIKIRCMRKTLHTVTQELAPVLHLATLELRTTEIESKLKQEGYLLADAEKIISKLGDITCQIPKQHKQLLILLTEQLLKVKTPNTLESATRTARLILKLAWERGHICYLNRATHWARENRFFGSTAKQYPNMSLEMNTLHEATDILVSRYIRAFEPVSIKDIAWWSGIRLSRIRQALNNIMPSLVYVEIENVGRGLLMTKEGFKDYLEFLHNIDTKPWCAFLAYEDPTLKGYFETRRRYVDDVFYDRLFNTIGECRPSVLINGRVAGIWTWQSKKRKIIIEWFVNPSKEELKLVEPKRRALEEFLDESSQLKLTL